MRSSVLTEKDLDAAMHAIADYYRRSRLYLSVFDVQDAYDSIIRSYKEDVRAMLGQGHSYQLKGNYLVAVDMQRFKEEYPSNYENWFGVVPPLLSYIERESGAVIFICAVGPKKGYFDVVTYRLIDEAVHTYGSNVILTDCPTEADIADFTKCTTSRKILLGGKEYFRWAPK